MDAIDPSFDWGFLLVVRVMMGEGGGVAIDNEDGIKARYFQAMVKR